LIEEVTKVLPGPMNLGTRCPDAERQDSERVSLSWPSLENTINPSRVALEMEFLFSFLITAIALQRTRTRAAFAQHCTWSTHVYGRFDLGSES
jgi:hypothetical protein